MAFFIFFVLFVFPFLQAGPLDNWASFLAWVIFIIIPLIVTVVFLVLSVISAKAYMNQQRANKSYTSITYKMTTNSAPNPFKLFSVLTMTINAKMAVPITSPKFTFAYVFSLFSTLSNTDFPSLSTKARFFGISTLSHGIN